jgi:hypothetical protein
MHAPDYLKFREKNGVSGSANLQIFIRIGYAVPKWQQDKMRNRKNEHPVFETKSDVSSPGQSLSFLKIGSFRTGSRFVGKLLFWYDRSMKYKETIQTIPNTTVIPAMIRNRFCIVLRSEIILYLYGKDSIRRNNYLQQVLKQKCISLAKTFWWAKFDGTIHQVDRILFTPFHCILTRKFAATRKYCFLFQNLESLNIWLL